MSDIWRTAASANEWTCPYCQIPRGSDGHSPTCPGNLTPLSELIRRSHEEIQYLRWKDFMARYLAEKEESPS